MSSGHQQVVFVDCVDGEDGPIEDSRKCHKPASSRTGWFNKTESFDDRHAEEMLRIISRVPPDCSFYCDQHTGFVGMMSQSLPSNFLPSPTIHGKESLKCPCKQGLPDAQKNIVKTKLSSGEKTKQEELSLQRPKEESIPVTSRKLPPKCPSHIPVVTPRSVNMKARPPLYKSKTTEGSTNTSTLLTKCTLKRTPETEEPRPTTQDSRRVKFAIEYTYYMNHDYSEITTFRPNRSNVQTCTPIASSDGLPRVRAYFFANHLRGEIPIQLYQITTFVTTLGSIVFRPLLCNFEVSQLFKAVKLIPPDIKRAPAPFRRPRTIDSPYFPFVYVEEADACLDKNEWPSFQGDNDKSHSPPRISINPYAENLVLPSPGGELMSHGQQAWLPKPFTNQFRNQTFPIPHMRGTISSEVQTTPEIFDTLTTDSKVRERSSTSIFSRIQRRFHKLGPKSGRHK